MGFLNKTILSALLLFSSSVCAQNHNGWIFGMSGDIEFYTNKNKDFVVKSIDTNDFTPSNENFPQIKFQSKLEHGYSGQISFGHLGDYGIERNVEVGYRRIKNKNQLYTESNIETDAFTFMLGGTHYLQVPYNINPYVSFGIGLAVTNSKGEIYDQDDIEASLGTPQPLVFDNMKVNKVAYQAGIGLATSINNIIIGAGYKFFGIAAIEDGDLSSIGEVSYVSQALDDPLKNFKFGKLKNNIHTVDLFLKKLI